MTREDNDRRGAALVFLRWHLMKGKRLGLLWKGEFKATQHQSKNDFFAEAKTKTTLVDVLDICMDTCEEEKGDKTEPEVSSPAHGREASVAYRCNVAKSSQVKSANPGLLVRFG